MKVKKFDVVELKDNNRAIILNIYNNKYFAEIVNAYGITVEKKNISNNDIKRIVYSKEEKER